MSRHPQTEKLLKILKMTTSPNDNEALVAIRKVNEMLKSNNCEWDDIIRQIEKYDALVDKYNELVRKYNRLVR